MGQGKEPTHPSRVEPQLGAKHFPREFKTTEIVTARQFVALLKREE
jgi:hypothetical protein